MYPVISPCRPLFLDTLDQISSAKFASSSARSMTGKIPSIKDNESRAERRDLIIIFRAKNAEFSSYLSTRWILCFNRDYFLIFFFVSNGEDSGSTENSIGSIDTIIERDYNRDWGALRLERCHCGNVCRLSNISINEERRTRDSRSNLLYVHISRL